MAGGQPWMMWEIELLREQFQTKTVPEIQRTNLPHRSVSAIYRALRKNGISTSIPKHNAKDYAKFGLPWSKDEDNLLRKYYPTMTPTEIHKNYMPERTIAAIRKRAADLHIQKAKPRPVNSHNNKAKKKQPFAWSKQNVQILQDHYLSMTAEEIQITFLPDIPINTIRSKIQDIGLNNRQTTWSPEELTILAKAEEYTLPELKQKLPHKTEGQIKYKLQKLGLKRKPMPRTELKHGATWTQAEINKLNMFKKGMPLTKIQSEHLQHRTLDSLSHKRNRLKSEHQ